MNSHLNREDILRRVPHGERACLLDSVLSYDAQSITCAASAPGHDHPYASVGGVASVIAIEYAAQASAVHGTLIERSATARDGMLATLRDVELCSDCLAGALTIRAELIGRSEAGCMYAFEVLGGDGATAVRGRLTVALK